MEGDEIFASIDSLWFFSSVFVQPSPKLQHNGSCSPGELQPRRQDSTETHKANIDCGGQDPACSRDAAAVETKRRSAAARSRELVERIDIWEKQWPQTYRAAAAAPPAMPPPGDGHAMKAHLRSWAHVVACSVR